jgi:hypothetical protein
LSSAILSTSYLPPIQYISKFLLYEKVIIEKFENYQKQSYRNRCYIYGANGKQCLTIPVKKQHGEKTPIAEVEIDNNYSWQTIHLKSIESAYRLSPFYEFYADGFKEFYQQDTQLLLDWNFNLLQFVLRVAGIPKVPERTTGYNRTVENCIDLRNSIHPKPRLMQPDPAFSVIPYQQVFRERNGFLPNLSIVDLLFNEGPLTLEVLRRSLKS